MLSFFLQNKLRCVYVRAWKASGNKRFMKCIIMINTCRWMNKWVKDKFSEIYNAHFPPFCCQKVWLRREWMNMWGNFDAYRQRKFIFSWLSSSNWAGDEMEFMNEVLQIIIVAWILGRIHAFRIIMIGLSNEFQTDGSNLLGYSCDFYHNFWL